MKLKYFICFLLFLTLFVIISNTLLINKDFTFAEENINKQKAETVFETLEDKLLIARKHYYNGNLNNAINTYKEILSVDSENIIALKNLIFIYAENADFKNALRYNNLLLEHNIEDIVKWRLNKGILLYQSGDFNEAEVLLKMLYHDISKNNEKFISKNIELLLYYYLGDIYFRNNKLSQAADFFNLGIKEFPEITLNYLGLAKIYEKEEQYKEAISAYKSALGKDSSLSFVYPELASLYERLNSFEEAYYYWNKSQSTGNQIELAQKKLELLKKNFPQLVITEQEKKIAERKKIKWSSVEPVTARDELPDIRIGLSKNANSIKLQAGSSFIITNKNTDMIFFEGREKTEYEIITKKGYFYIYQNDEDLFYIENNTSIIFEFYNFNSTFFIYDINFDSGYFWAGTEDRQFRGKIELYPLNNQLFNVINIVNMEEYLFSVIPAEMPAWWPDEALKAQAIAARTYALVNIGKHADEGYDLCATVHCAVYNGVKSENSRTNKAVLATRGEVATYNNRVIEAVFSSNSGGYSESSADIWGNRHTYLSGANNMINDDKYRFPLEPYQLFDWLSDKPSSFSKNAYAGINIYRWTRILDIKFLEKRFNLKNIKRIIPAGRTNGGSVNKIIIEAKNKTIEISRDNIRGSLGGLKSNRFILKPIYTNQTIDKVIFWGAGWGHNVGMDQTAAAGMADLGYKYEEIVKHFYKETELIKKY